MIHLTVDTRILIAVKPVDFRRQIDGLIALCLNELKCDPRSSTLYAFINRSRTMIRVLCYADNGYWLMTKRLSKGRYHDWPNDKMAVSAVDSCQLIQMLKGVVASN